MASLTRRYRARPSSVRYERAPFDVGCDDRYRGLNLADCPYKDQAEVSEWEAGWKAVDAAMTRAAQAGDNGKR